METGGNEDVDKIQGVGRGWMKLTEETRTYQTIIDGVLVILKTRNGEIEEVGTKGKQVDICWFGVQLLNRLPYINKAVEIFNQSPPTQSGEEEG